MIRVNGALDTASGRGGVAYFVEQVDKRYLERHGLDGNGALYKPDQRSNLEPEALRKTRELLKELKDARQTVELMDACGKRVCSSEEHWGCPYGNEGMTDCAVLLEAAYEDTVEKLLALKETLEG